MINIIIDFIAKSLYNITYIIDDNTIGAGWKEVSFTACHLGS